MNQYLRAEVKAIDTKGTWTAVASAPSIDRDGERILARALTWRSPSIPVHAGHSFEVTSLVGRCSPYYDSKGTLMVDGRFGSSDLAQATRSAVVDKTLTDMSIVFIDAKKRRGDDGVQEITAGELVACDFVTIASNVDARVLAARSYSGGLTVADARALVDETLRDLALLELKEAQELLDRDRGPARRLVDQQLRSI